MAGYLGSVGKSRDSIAKMPPSDTRSNEESTNLSSDGRSDNEIEKNRGVSKNERPSGSRSDSKADTVQSGANGDNDLTKSFERLEVSTDEIEGETHGDQTPQQRRERGEASKGRVKQKIDFDVAQYHNDGKWLEDHPWKSEKPSRKEPTNTTVEKSDVYPLPDKWLQGKTIDLEMIYSSLPTFIDEMKGPSIRKELEDIINSTLLKVIGSTNSKLSPHVLEIAQKQNDVTTKDLPSRPKIPPKIHENDNLKAFTLPEQEPDQPSRNNYWFLDCEYMLKMYLPVYSSQWFNCEDHQGKRITEINPEKQDKRWIFIPSFRRAKIALLDWPKDPKDDIVTQKPTIRILVVRPSEFEEYVKYCGHRFPVTCLPQDEIGAGYPRYWIQKIALRLNLQFIWMIDDSVECFYEYHPNQEPSERQVGKKVVKNYTDYRRRQFGLVFERIEDFFNEDDNEKKPIAAMSPRRWNPRCKPKKPFSCMPPQGAVYLNLRVLSEKNVYYRPELKTFEDMIFGYECEKKGLKVYRDNRILLKDHDWKNTGASSPSVKSK